MSNAILTFMNKLKDVPGWEGQYAVTKTGKVWAYPRHRFYPRSSIRRSCTKFYSGRWLSQATTPQGYKQVAFWRDGKSYAQKVHTLIATTFLQPINDKPIINHKDGNKINNNVENLEWCTHKENTIHAFITGLRTSPKGQQHGMAKLSQQDVLKMRTFYANGVKKSYLAKQFGISKTQAGKICNGVAWNHLV